jgi:hypothetical protein
VNRPSTTTTTKIAQILRVSPACDRRAIILGLEGLVAAGLTVRGVCLHCGGIYEVDYWRAGGEQLHGEPVAKHSNRWYVRSPTRQNRWVGQGGSGWGRVQLDPTPHRMHSPQRLFGVRTPL